MGKSDPIVFAEYSRVLSGLYSCESTAFLGFSGESDFTRSIESPVRHFYDKHLNNWEINSNWTLLQKYDLIVCTRCAYFSKEPSNFIEKCKNYLNENGHALIDWGLGDHWRFENYKVGWVKDGEHEWAYNTDNKLYSCYWNYGLEKDLEVEAFWKAIHQKKFSYNNELSLDEIVRKEVPSIVYYPVKKIRIKFLWPDSPQLYIITLIEK